MPNTARCQGLATLAIQPDRNGEDCSLPRRSCGIERVRRGRRMGTPAEEELGGNIKLVDAGVYVDVDTALMLLLGAKSRHHGRAAPAPRTRRLLYLVRGLEFAIF